MATLCHEVMRCTCSVESPTRDTSMFFEFCVNETGVKRLH